jgi:mono/diheme cytochrome c family protein
VKRTKSGYLVALAGALLAGAACSGCDSGGPTTPYERGQVVYKSVCVACHDHDPSRPGTVGPPLAGSSAELLRHRVLHGTYPPGYVPKRGDSKLMPQFPHLAGSIDDLAAFLAGAGS